MIDQSYLYPESRQFDTVAVDGQTLTAVTRMREEHCMGHFIHKPMLPLSEIGSMASRAAALHCQYLASQDAEFWETNPVAVVAKYSPSEVKYSDPFVENDITLTVKSTMEKFSRRLCTVCVTVYGLSEMGTHIEQSFDFKMAFRKDLGPWR